MQQIEFFHAHEVYSVDSLFGVTHKLTDTHGGGVKKYSCSDDERVMRLLALLPSPLTTTLIEAQLPPVYHKDSSRTRFAFYWPCSSDSAAEIRKEASHLGAQVGKLFAQDANDLARNCRIHVLWNGEREKILAICTTLYVENGEAARRALSFIRSPPQWDKSMAEVSDDDVPSCAGFVALPNTGSVRYECTVYAGSGTVIEFGQLGISKEKLFAEELIVRRRVTAMKNTELRHPMLLEKVGKGVKLSTLFTSFCRAYNNRKRSRERREGSNDDEDAAFDLEAKHTAYVEEIRSRFKTVIDLQNTADSWAPNQSGELQSFLLKLVRSGAKELKFADANDLMNLFIAKERPPGTSIWYKAPGSNNTGDNERGCKLVRCTLTDFSKDRGGIFLKLRAPEDPDEREVKLRAVKVDKDSDTFYWMDWYLKYGCREVAGQRFMPLTLGENVRDADQAEWINTFRGFRCHSWLVEESERAISIELMRSQLCDNGSALNFLLRHVLDLAGGNEEAARVVHGWIAHLCFRPSYKHELPLMLIFIGPPGCGKSSFVQKLGEWLLNSAHIVTVTNARHLIGHFNKHMEDKVLCAAEEFDLKDQRKEENQALQELVSGKTVFGEQKGVDGEMRRSHTRYCLCTNADSPVITNPNNRKFMLLSYDIARAVRFEHKSDERNAHLARLAEVLDDLKCWRAYAAWLFTEFHHQLESWAASVATRRHFNHTTLRTQIACLWSFAEWSALAFLIKFVEKRAIFVTEGHHWVYYDPHKPDKFTEWENWASMMNRQQRDPVAERFKNHDWRLCADDYSLCDNWWQKMQRYRLYSMYTASVPRGQHRVPVLAEADFYYSLERILMADPDNPAMLKDTAVGSYVDTRRGGGGGAAPSTVSEARDWIALAPLGRLEEAIERALPASMGFSWESYRAEEKKLAEARTAMSF